MQTILYQNAPMGYPTLQLDQWQQNMEQKIETWYTTIPRGAGSQSSERKVVENFDLTRYRALFFLYHPAPKIPAPNETAWLRTTDAAINMIRLYRQFFDERRLTIYWQAVEGLSAAGTAILTGYTVSSSVRAATSISSLRELVQTCSSVLWAMVEHFAAFKSKRDKFDQLAARVLGELSKGGIGSELTESPLSLPAVENEIEPQYLPVNNLTRETTYSMDELQSGTDTMDFPDLELTAVDWDALTNQNEFVADPWF